MVPRVWSLRTSALGLFCTAGTQGLDLGLRQWTPGAQFKFPQLEGSLPPAVEVLDLSTQLLNHAPDLVEFSLVDGQFGQTRGQGAEQGGTGQEVSQVQALGAGLDLGWAQGLPCVVETIVLPDAPTWAEEAVGQLAVVGQQQEA